MVEKIELNPIASVIDQVAEIYRGHTESVSKYRNRTASALAVEALGGEEFSIGLQEMCEGSSENLVEAIDALKIEALYRLNQAIKGSAVTVSPEDRVEAKEYVDDVFFAARMRAETYAQAVQPAREVRGGFGVVAGEMLGGNVVSAAAGSNRSITHRQRVANALQPRSP